VSAAVTLAPGTGLCHGAAPLPLARGGVLDPVHIAYESRGDEGLPLVFALGGISAGRHVSRSRDDARPGWWDAFVGPGRALDTDRFRVVGIDWLGGRGESTNPVATEDPARFPAVTTIDQAAALALLLEHFGIERAHAIVGGSYGGMVALAFAATYPAHVGRVVALGAAHRSHPFATALRAVQRRIVALGLRTGAGADALALARSLALTTYRTAAEFADRFDGPAVRRDGRFRFPVEDYLDHHGQAFAATFAAENFLRLSESIDLHDVEPAMIRAPATLVAFEDDPLVPPWQVRQLAAALGTSSTLHVLPSRYGHDAFLKEDAALTPLIAAALALEVAS